MERTVAQQKFNVQDCHVVGFDVSAKTLNWYTEEPGADGRILERQSRIVNRTGAIGELLQGLSELADRQGKGLLVACEPSGGYERKLMRLARAKGALTCYVSGEATHKLTILESNDTGKNDPKDARVIYRIAGLRTALLTDRQTACGYEQLRELNRFYEDEDEQVVQVRNAISALRRKLFCDLRAGSDWLFGGTGQAFLALYRGNPNRAVSDGWERFQQNLKRCCPRVPAKTLRRLWEDVQSSACLLQPDAVMAQWEARLATLMDDWRRHELRKADLKATMVSLYERLPEFIRLSGTGVSTFALARIIAETGPLSDYRSWRQLLRLAGLNLNVHQSGAHKGQTRISKKGSALLRKVLYQQTFAVLTQGRGLFADYFRKRRQGDHPVLAKKLYVNVMRKFLRALFGAYHDGCFITARVFLDEIHYARHHAA